MLYPAQAFSNVSSSNDDWRFYYIKNEIAINTQKTTAFIQSINYQEAVEQYNAKLYAMEARQRAARIQTVYYGNRWTSQAGSATFYDGNCTKYVSSKVAVPWGGNANEWLNNSAAQGFEHTDDPQVGDIIVTNESSYGHVTFVEEVYSDGTVLVSEGNYKGYGIESNRVLAVNDPKIQGVIDM